MAETSLNDIQLDLKEVSELYVRITTLMMELGYDSFLEQLESVSEIECLEMTTRVLEVMEEVFDDYPTLVLDDDEEELFAEAAAAAAAVVENGEKVFGTIDQNKLESMVRESLEQSISERIIQSLTPQGSFRNRTYQQQQPIEVPKKKLTMNEKLAQMNARTKQWREQRFQTTDVPKKWTTSRRQQQQFDDDDFYAPETSVERNATGINVEDLGLEF